MPGFLSSNLYYKYLNDLINSVRADEFFGGNAIAPLGQDGDRGTSTSDDTQAQVSTEDPIFFSGVQNHEIQLVLFSARRCL